jgi:hypothetical protein
MSIKKLLKRILKPIITEIIEELLQEKVHDNVQYNVSKYGVEIKANFFFRNILEDRVKRNQKRNNLNNI